MGRLYEYKQQNLSYWTKWEKWFYDGYLIKDWIKKRIKRQTIIWQRICDFTLSNYWIRVEIDWKHHNTSWYKAYDKKRDRIIFERYWWITLRIEDFDDIKARNVIEYIKDTKRNHSKRLEFIKKNIRDKDIKDIDREKYSDEWKKTIDYYLSLYKEEIKKPKKVKEVKKPIERKILVDKKRDYSMWVSMLYSSFKR